MSSKKKILFALGLVAIAVAGRLLPHLWNFTPLVAVSLFAGVYLGKRYALAVPLVAMVVSDFFIGFYALPVMLSVYGSFALIGLFGFLMKRFEKLAHITGFAAISSIFFYLVTNFAVWQWGIMYPHTLDGLLMSYAMGLPFLKTMILGDMFYTFTLFSVFRVVIGYRIGEAVAVMYRSKIKRQRSKLHLQNQK